MEISERLGKLSIFYHREARKCVRARAYMAATVLQMAALEATLQAMCFIYAEKVKKTAVYRQKRFRRKRYKALEFSLYELINIANELSWFPQKRIIWGGKRANLAGFSHETRKLRNLVHPGEWARRRWSMMKFTKPVYNVVYEVCDISTSWLLHHNEEAMLQTIRRAEQRRKNS